MLMPTITQSKMVGELSMQKMPPPAGIVPKTGSSMSPPLPPPILNPLIVLLSISPLEKRTVGEVFPGGALIEVSNGPATLSTKISLPRKSIASMYSPGETRTVSPVNAASIPAWIVG